MGEFLREIYERLYGSFGPQGWWPAETPFEVFVGAILTQNTAWANVEKAIDRLKGRGALEPHRIMEIPEEELQELLRPTGYYRIKAKRLKEAVKFLIGEFGGSMERMAREPLEELRQKLLRIRGIGPETADSILLYACHKPIFVVDAYTKRILQRHGLIRGNVSYDELQGLFMDHLPKDVELYKEYHALLVRVGKTHCRPKPKCDGCPLKGVNYEPDTGQEGEEACG